MTENQNVGNEANSQEIDEIVSRLIVEIINGTAPSSSSFSPPKYGDSNVHLGNTSRHTQATRPERLLQVAQVHSFPRERKPTYEIYRATGQFSESQSDIDVDLYMTPQANNAAKNRIVPPTAPSVPPSYSTVIKQGRPSLDLRRDVRSMETHHLSPFARIPPPSYAEIHGVWSRDFSTASSEQILLGPEPIYIWCSRCATVVITETQPQRSKFTHLTAAALCLFGCWPCAMLPYCMNSCKNIYHYCPDCNYLFGMYRPW